MPSYMIGNSSPLLGLAAVTAGLGCQMPVIYSTQSPEENCVQLGQYKSSSSPTLVEEELKLSKAGSAISSPTYEGYIPTISRCLYQK